jgi:hypothetical protein
MTYTVVLLDGKEHQNLSLEEVKDLFFRRQINQNSLICTSENPQWQMLKRSFDVSQWIPSGAPQLPPPTNYQNNFQPQQPNFNQQNSYNQPVTFNQFPQNQNNQPNNNFAQNTSNGYSQNNQSETYYQAETNQSQYNFQNNQSNFAPSNYNQPSNNYNQPANHYNYSQNSNLSSEDRNGLRQAAVFLIVNVFINIVMTVIENLYAVSSPSGKFNGGIGRFAISLIIDMILAHKLWQKDDVETARKWVLIRTYFGFAVFGLIVPFYNFGTGEIFVGAINFVAYFLLFISITLVLHGKQSPSQSRVMIGMGTFAMFFLFNFGILALSAIALVAPSLGQLEIADKQFDKYKVEGTEFQDKTTGAKVVLPEGWSMLKLSNPLIHSPEARMIAVDKLGNSLTMLEVVPVPGNLNMKQANSIVVLDQLADNVVEHLKNDKDGDGFSGKGGFREITRMNIYIGKHPAKLLVFEKNVDGDAAKGHMIITYDELTFYVLHSWCPVKDYDKKQADFTFFEKNFNVPDKINSPFTQSAENEKNKANQKKNF